MRAWLYRWRWTVATVLVVGVSVYLAVGIRLGQIDSCERGNVLRAEIRASNTVLAGVIGVVLPDPPLTADQLAGLTPRQRLQVERFIDGRTRLNTANARLTPARCGSIWGLI